MISWLIQAFTHLDNIFTEDFSAKFTEAVKSQILTRLGTMTEKDLKDVDKDELGSLI